MLQTGVLQLPRHRGGNSVLYAENTEKSEQSGNGVGGMMGKKKRGTEEADKLDWDQYKKPR